MREQLEQRRATLQQEYERGAAMLQQMERDRETLTQTLLRIDGARQILDELLRGIVADEEVEHGGNH